jgi:hypothetical protein
MFRVDTVINEPLSVEKVPCVRTRVLRFEVLAVKVEPSMVEKVTPFNVSVLVQFCVPFAPMVKTYPRVTKEPSALYATVFRSANLVKSPEDIYLGWTYFCM